jgi:hypothetical protein
MSRKYARNPGADQVQAWKRAIAQHNKAKRRNRWKREPAGYTPGMNIIPAAVNDQQIHETATASRSSLRT